MNTPGLILALPLFLSAPLFGLIPLITGPVLIFLITVILAPITASRSHSKSIFLIALTLMLAAIALRAPSHALEKCLVLSVCLLYGWVLANFKDQQKDLIPIALISASSITAAIFLGSHFLTTTRPDFIALANPNALALHLALTLPLTVDQIIDGAGSFSAPRHPEGVRRMTEGSHKEGLGLRALLLLMLTVQLAALILTRSLGIIASLIASSVFALSVKKRTKILAAASFLALVFLVKWQINPRALGDRLSWARTAINIFSDYPVRGALKEGGFASLHPLYKGDLSSSQSTIIAHNLYLEVLSDVGVLGILLLIGIFLEIRKKTTHPLPWPCQISIIVFLLSGLFDSSHLFLPNLLAFCAIVALCVQPNIPSSPSFSAVTHHLILLVFFSFISSQSLRLLMARSLMIRGELHMSANPREARLSLIKSLYWDRKNAYAWVDLMKTELILSALDSRKGLNALIAAKEATYLDPANIIYLRNLQILRTQQ